MGVGDEDVLLLRGQRGAHRRGEQPDARHALGEELPGHAQMEQETAAVVERRDQVLADAHEIERRAAAQPRPQALGRSQEEVARTGGMDGGDAAADERGTDALARHLDLGQLRHVRTSGAPGREAADRARRRPHGSVAPGLDEDLGLGVGAPQRLEGAGHVVEADTIGDEGRHVDAPVGDGVQRARELVGRIAEDELQGAAPC